MAIQVFYYQLQRFRSFQLDVAVTVQRQARADEIGLHRYFTLAAVDEDGEQDLARPAVIENLIHRGAHRATGLQHVVDQHDAAAVDVGRQFRRLYRGYPG